MDQNLVSEKNMNSIIDFEMIEPDNIEHDLSYEGNKKYEQVKSNSQIN